MTLPLCPSCAGHMVREAVWNVAIPHYSCTNCGIVWAGLGIDLQPCADADSHIRDRFILHRPFPHLPSTIQPGPDSRGLL